MSLSRCQRKVGGKVPWCSKGLKFCEGWGSLLDIQGAVEIQKEMGQQKRREVRKTPSTTSGVVNVAPHRNKEIRSFTCTWNVVGPDPSDTNLLFSAFALDAKICEEVRKKTMLGIWLDLPVRAAAAPRLFFAVAAQVLPCQFSASCARRCDCNRLSSFRRIAQLSKLLCSYGLSIFCISPWPALCLCGAHKKMCLM
jgi:hypothetical protein